MGERGEVGVSERKPSEPGMAFSFLFHVSGWRDLGLCACESLNKRFILFNQQTPNLRGTYIKLEPHHYCEISDI